MLLPVRHLLLLAMHLLLLETRTLLVSTDRPGVDAAVALDFHQMRERRPEWPLGEATRRAAVPPRVGAVQAGTLVGVFLYCHMFK